MKHSSKLFVVISALGVFASTKIYADACSEKGMQNDIMVCRNKSFNAVDQQRLTIYRCLLSGLSPLQQERLRSAEEALLNYRDALCRYSSMEDDLHEGDVRPSGDGGKSTCMEQITRDHVQYLKAWKNAAHVPSIIKRNIW